MQLSKPQMQPQVKFKPYILGYLQPSEICNASGYHIIVSSHFLLTALITIYNSYISTTNNKFSWVLSTYPLSGPIILWMLQGWNSFQNWYVVIKQMNIDKKYFPNHCGCHVRHCQSKMTYFLCQKLMKIGSIVVVKTIILQCAKMVK